MIALLLSTVILGCHAVSISPEILVREQWENYKLQFNKIYNGETEEQYRLKIFMDNLHYINEHNELYHQGLYTFSLGINEFSDLLHEEFLNIFTVNAPDYYGDKDDDVLIHIPNNDTHLPEDSLDWRTRGAVTPVKKQGWCGSCYCFAVTGALEAAWHKKTGKLVSLSEQNLLDCTVKYGNSGCRGGYPAKTFQYIIDNGGIDTETSYPYEGKVMKCRYSVNNIGAKQQRYGRAESGSESSLKSVVSNIGPTTVCIDYHDPNFQHYAGGIYSNPRCSQTRGGHIVLVVGYGSEAGHDYWLVKNSWGTGWGEKGYVRMTRNKNNQCGIASWAFYPLV